MPSIGERVANLRIDKGMSQEQLASEVRVNQAGISHIETNRRTPSLRVAIRLANFFGVTLDELVGRDVSALRTKAEKDLYPEKYAAHVAVNKAIFHGELQPAKTYECASCEKQAEQWHHPSYHPEHHLDVVPLCRACHKKVHMGALEIAIAGL